MPGLEGPFTQRGDSGARLFRLGVVELRRVRLMRLNPLLAPASAARLVEALDRPEGLVPQARRYQLGAPSAGGLLRIYGRKGRFH